MTLARAWIPRAAIACAAALTFARALPYALQRSWDDGRFILDNEDVRQPSCTALWRMFSSVQFEAYHPLHLLSYWLDVPWSDAQPWVLHAVSLALWVGALWLVYALFRSLDVPVWAACAATLLVGLHPVQVEAVSWASGRKDVLALLLSAASLLLQLRAQKAFDAPAWGARAFYVLALLAKTTAIPLPLFAFAIDVSVRRSPWRAAALRQLPNLVLGAIVGGCVLVIWADHGMLRQTLGGPELAPLRVVQTLGHQLLTTCWPARTSPMYSTLDVGTWQWPRSIAFAVFVGAWAIAWRRRAGLAVAGLCGYACLMLPVSNLVPMYYPLQDRYLSLPLLPLAFVVAALLQSVSRHVRFAQLLAFVMVAGLALRCWQYQGVWHDELQLWGHAAHTHPDADYAWLKLGEVRRDAGQLEGAITAYRFAVRTAPSRKLTHAALFEAVALRDERNSGLQPSAARRLAQRYYMALDQPEALRSFAHDLFSSGYVRAGELPLQLSLLLDPWPDSVLERAALAAARAGRFGLSRFYVQMMKQPPDTESLKDILQHDYFPVLP